MKTKEIKVGIGNILTVLALIISTFAVFNTAQADSDIFISTFVGSYHFNRNEENCEFNPGLGIQYYLDDYDFLEDDYVAAGVYKNSPCRTAAYGFYGVETDTSKWYGVGIAGGLVSGYTQEDFSTAPVVAYPYFRLGARRHRVNARLVVLPVPDGLVGLAVNIKLGD